MSETSRSQPYKVMIFQPHSLLRFKYISPLETSLPEDLYYIYLYKDLKHRQLDARIGECMDAWEESSIELYAVADHFIFTSPYLKKS